MKKVLHIVEGFDGQATEKWLSILIYESLRCDSGISWTFFCIGKYAGRYSKKIEELGCKVICSPYMVSDYIRFMLFLRETVKTGGFEIIHSHHDLMSGMYFFSTIGLPFRQRIMQIHNSALRLPTNNKLKEIFLSFLFRQLCFRLADYIVGVSDSALNNYLGRRSRGDRSTVIHCAIDNVTSSELDFSLATFRGQLGIPTTALLLLFVGRLTTYKNPSYVIDIVDYFHKINIDAYGVFVGEGNERQRILDIAINRGIGAQVKCLGWRDDVRKIMAASDVLIFPSLETPMEGLGLSVVEAQSVGLPVLMSLSVPNEAIVIPELVKCLSLKSGPAVWGETVRELLSQTVTLERDECAAIVRNSSFSPFHSLTRLNILYENYTDPSFNHEKCLPNFIVIGASKCGTTSLHEYLSTHPEIFLSKQKELHFFQDDDASWGTWNRGLPWYVSQFSGASAHIARGECSPDYAHEDQTKIAARKMFSLLPEAKIVYMVRDPIKRVLSHYLEEVANGHLPEIITLNDVISAGPDGGGVVNHFFKVIIQSTLYHRQLECYLEYYPLANVHVIALEDLVVDPASELKKLFGFLGVYQDFIPPNIDHIYNTGLDKRIRVVNPTEFLRKFSCYNSFSSIIPNFVRNYYRLAISKPIDKTNNCSISPENLLYLHELFSEDTSLLSELLGRKFPRWSTRRN